MVTLYFTLLFDDILRMRFFNNMLIIANISLEFKLKMCFFQIQFLFWSECSLQFPKIGNLSKVKCNTLYLGYIFSLNCIAWNSGEWCFCSPNLCTILVSHRAAICECFNVVLGFLLQSQEQHAAVKWGLLQV